MTDEVKPFRYGHLVRLRGFDHDAFDGKLVRVVDMVDEATGKNQILFLDETVRPPVPVIPLRVLMVQPQLMQHACEHCLVASATLQMCGKCKTSHYCNAECQLADWARHKTKDCNMFGSARGMFKPLPSACAGGDMAEVRHLVEVEGANVNKCTSSGPTPLCAAATTGQLVVVRYLLKKGADVNKANMNGVTPLYAAAQMGPWTVAQCLVEHGADLNKADSSGHTPLIMAALKGNLPVLQYLVQQGADKEKATSGGMTPLFIAAENGFFMGVKYLVEQGADKDKASAKDATPLFVAAHKG